MLAKLMQDLGLRAALAETVGAHVRTWAEAFPDEFLAVKPTAAQWAETDGVPSARAMLLAERQVALFDALLASGALDSKEQARVREHGQLIVPMLRE